MCLLPSLTFCGKCWAKTILLNQNVMFWYFSSNFIFLGHILIIMGGAFKGAFLAFPHIFTWKCVNVFSMVLIFFILFLLFCLSLGHEVKVTQQFPTWTIKLMFLVVVFNIQLLKYYNTWTILTQFILFSKTQFFWKTID